ncbi:MAG: amidophosphoribosyltransferase [Candidatus Peregrinibacteria bacterium]|nr:amidophosphoribosyltransferase [Candidatus Peregrinibacteria bacterium]
MCGILAVSGFRDAIQDLYDGLIVLQHRGQDAAGIVTYNNQFHLKKANGMVRDVFHAQSLDRLRGPMGIGHVRYPTAGCSSEFEAQPFFVNSPFGIALAHNGNLTNAKELSRDLLHTDFRHLNTTSDSEVLLNVFALALQKQRPIKLQPEHIFRAVRTVHRRCRGSYSAVALIGGQGIVAFRDPYGIRPLQLGKRKYGMKEEFMLCSENTVLRPLGYEFVRDLLPGECVFIDRKNKVHARVCKRGHLAPCSFEWVYLAAPDSILDNVSVYKARIRMGESLAPQIRTAGIHIDSVIPIPDSSRAAAAGLADKLKIRYREGFVKNRYIGRTFIMPGQALRQRSLHFKIHPIELEFRGNNVLLVDDSIVRGNTSRKIVEMARESGAKKVYFASASPPLTGPCPYGVDIPTTEELIGSNHSIEEIREMIGADGLYYAKVEDMVKAIRVGNRKLQRLCTGCFNGRYSTPDITKKILLQLGSNRNVTRETGDAKEEEEEGARAMTLI